MRRFMFFFPSPSVHVLAHQPGSLGSRSVQLLSVCLARSARHHGTRSGVVKRKAPVGLYHYCQLLQPSRHHGYDVGHRCASSYRFKQLLLLLILLPTLFLLTLQYTLLPPSPTEIIKAPSRDPLLKFSLLKFLHFSWKLPALLKLLRELLMPLTPL